MHNSLWKKQIFEYNIISMIDKIIENINKAENDAQAIEKDALLKVAQIEQKNQLDIEKILNQTEIDIRNEVDKLNSAAEEQSHADALEHLAKSGSTKTKKQNETAKIDKAKKFIIAEFNKIIK